MGQRIYKVHFEAFIDGRWNTNMFSRRVAVVGGAEQAIKVAMTREKADDKRDKEKPLRYRVEQVSLIASED